MVNETYQVLANEQEFTTFLERLGDIFPWETYLVNTAFRSKKLSETEKVLLGARNREVYLTKTLRGTSNNRVDVESAILKMHELEVPFSALTFNKGTEKEVTLPQEAMTTFICCNPSNERRVALEHRNVVDEITKNISLASDNGVDGKNQLAHCNHDYRSERMKCNRTKWVDFDVDIENLKELRNESKAAEIKAAIKEHFHNSEKFFKSTVNGVLVSTSGGYHVLVDSTTLKNNPFMFAKSLKADLAAMGADIKELEFKSGCCMIPCPGVLQYGVWEVCWEEL